MGSAALRDPDKMLDMTEGAPVMGRLFELGGLSPFEPSASNVNQYPHSIISLNRQNLATLNAENRR
jgi:hypothetical protein